MYGRDEADLVGRPWDSLVDPVARDEYLADADRMARGDPRELHRLVRILRPDGSIIHVLFIVSVRPGDESADMYFVSLLQDVSQHVGEDYYLRLVLDSAPVSLLLADGEGRVLFGAGQATGEMIAPETTLTEAFAGNPALDELCRRTHGGTTVQATVDAFGRTLALRLIPLRGPTGSITMIAVVATDISERERAVRAARARSAEQAIVARLGQLALDTLDLDQLLRQATTALADQLQADSVAIYDLQAEEGAAQPVASVGRSPGPAPSAGEPDRALTVRVASAGDPHSLIVISRDHQPSDADIASEKPFSGEEIGFVRSVGTVLESAAVRYRLEREIRERSLRDALTGLPNRAALLDGLDTALSRASPDGPPTAVLFMDLDGFKPINDSLGHDAGDQFLREVATRLRLAVRHGDVVARLGGDEFAVVCPQTTADTARDIARRINEVLSIPADIAGETVAASASVGVAVSANVGGASEPLTSKLLLRCADTAMYMAKRQGPGRALVYDEAMPTAVVPAPSHGRST